MPYKVTASTIPTSTDSTSNHLDSEATAVFSDFCELLVQIDKRLKQEDSEYKAKYYPDNVQDERN